MRRREYNLLNEFKKYLLKTSFFSIKKQGLIKFLVPINIHSFVFSPTK